MTRPFNNERPKGVRRLFRLRRVDSAPDIDEEVRFHIDAARDELIAQGMDAGNAHAQAMARFGNVATITHTLRDLTRERERIMQRTEWFDAIRQDLRFGLRQLRKTPGFTMIALLTLALGIGANTAIFSIVYSVLLRPLPYAGAERLLLVQQAGESEGSTRVVPYGNFGVWERESKMFEALGAYEFRSVTLTGAGDPQRISGMRASAGLFRAQYIRPILGRYYDAASDIDGAPPVVILSYPLWVNAFGSDSSIVGRNVLFDGMPHQVVAVAAPEYSMTRSSAQFWTPLAMTAEQRGTFGDHELAVIGLLRKGVTPSQGVAELSRIDTQLAQEYPNMGFNGGIVVKPLVDAIVGKAKQQYLLLLGAVALVLLIACGNVANLMLARAASRRSEMAVRRALGATRSRIVAQLMVEGAALAIGGAILGVAVGAIGIRVLVAATPSGVPRIQDASLNGYVLLFSVVLTVFSAMFFGLLPAMKSAGTNLQDTLRDGGREGRARVRDSVRRSLIVGEVALALVLLAGAGLLIRSAQNLQRVPVGFDPTDVFIGRIGLPASKYPSPDVIANTYLQIVDRVRSINGITSAGMIARAPIDRGGADCQVRAEGTEPNGNGNYSADYRSTTPGYFSTMRVPLRAGRDFSSIDRASAPLVAIINQSLARQLFGSANPIGKRIVQCIGASDGRSGTAWREVIGVVGDVHADGIAVEVPLQVFYPVTQFEEPIMTLVVRSALPPQNIAPLLRKELSAIDPELALANTRTMPDVLSGSLASSRFTTLLLILLGVTGLVLASVGIYGVITYFVSQRTHEMGIRMALGANSAQVMKLVLKQGLVLAGTGVVVGEFVAFLASRVLGNFVFGVSVRDPLTFVSVAVLLALVALSASLVPARRATKVDPLTSLR